MMNSKGMFLFIPEDNPFSCLLDRKFIAIAHDLQELRNGNRVLKYVMANDEHGVLLSITEDINEAIIDYQLSLQQDTNGQLWKLIVSPHQICNSDQV